MLEPGPQSNFVIWTIDPFEENVRLSSSDTLALKQVMLKMNAQIQALYVVSSSDSAEWHKKLSEAQKAMKSFLDKNNFVSPLAPKILLSKGSSVESRVEGLVQFAEEKNAKLIIATSRGANLLNKMVFGSFTEKLLSHSTCPLYFLSHAHDSRTEKPKNKVLFTTDFSKRSENIFDRFLADMKTSAPEIILYYAIALPVLAADTILGVPESFFAKQEEDARLGAEGWIEKAQANGMKIRYFGKNVGLSLSIVPSIVELAKNESVSFIAMASNSDKFEKLFFGSVAREVFNCNIPVWICGPHVGLQTERKRDSTWNFYDVLRNG